MSSCATQRFYLEGDPYTARHYTNPSYETMQSFFVGGILQGNDVDAKKVCGDFKVSHIETSLTLFDTLLSLLTRGLYTPRNAAVYCLREYSDKEDI